MMNEKKFCIIMCVNDDVAENECLKYISKLNVPEGYEIEQLSVRGASSMAAGYNEAMRISDAKYKIYTHQDVFVLKQDILYSLLDIFSDDAIGMIGLVGTTHLPDTAVMWQADRVGRIAICDISRAGDSMASTICIPGQIHDVEAVDGLFIATQIDIPWREDLFTGWDFYDVSQSFEMRKKGYRVVVPDMDCSWVLHDEGILNLDNYYRFRDVFLENYTNTSFALDLDEEYINARKKARMEKEDIDIILADSYRDRFKRIAAKFTSEFCEKIVAVDGELLTLFVIMSVLEKSGFDDKEKIFEDCHKLRDIVDRWNEIKYAMWEVEFEIDDDAEQKFYNLISYYSISDKMLKKMIETSSLSDEKMYMLLACIFIDHGEVERGKSYLETTGDTSS